MNPPEIQEYTFGKMVVDGKSYHKDLILFPDHVQENWRRDQGHSFSLLDVPDVLADPPEVLVVGTGNLERMRVPCSVLSQLTEMGISVVVEDTKTACQSYNFNRGQRRTIGAFHLSC